MHAETVEAGNWWARPRGATNDHWIATYQRSVGAKHRTALVDVLKTIQPETLLEVGCHCGPNLVRCAAEFPALEMLGVDINSDAIDAGKRWVTSQGLASRIQLTAGRMPAVTADLPDRCCDVVLSCYALAYIAPADLDAVLYEMGRLAAKAVILAEPMVLGTEKATHQRAVQGGYHEWAHQYGEAIKWINTWRGVTTTVGTITPPVDRLNAILVARRDGT